MTTTNTFNNGVKVIAEAALAVLEEDATFVKQVYKDTKMFGDKGDLKHGDTGFIKVPGFGTRHSGALAVPDGLNSTTVPIQMKQWNSSLLINQSEMSFNVTEDLKDLLRPNVASLINGIDTDLWALAADCAILAGTSGTYPADVLPFAQAKAKIHMLSGVTDDGTFKSVMHPMHAPTVINGLKALQNPVDDITKQYRLGKLGRVGNIAFSEDRNAGSLAFTGATYAGSGVMNGSTADGAVQIVTDGWTGGTATTFRRGDTVTCAGVYAVDPVSKASTGILYPMVVKETCTADGSNNLTLKIVNALVLTGPNQNVSALPADGQAITVYTATGVTPYGTSLVFHPTAFAFASTPVSKFPDLPCSIAYSDDLGISIMASAGSNIMTGTTLYRLDVNYAVARNTARPFLCGRVIG